MRLMIVLGMLLLNANAFANTSVVAAADYSCSELKALVQTHRELTVADEQGAVTFYAESKSCFDQGIMYTKFETIRAKDKWCAVGLICDIYFGN